MLRNNPKIAELMYTDAASSLSQLKGITLEESNKVIAGMSFIQYMNLLEASADIIPPSGQAIGQPAGTPSTPGGVQPPSSQQQKNQTSQNSQQKTQVMWAGKGTPIQKGMTVGLKGTTNQQVPGEITQVDRAANGVKVRNPTTGQEEWHNNDELQQFMNNNKMAEGIKRMKQLAGIAEDASGGASCAGGIAAAPMPMGNIKRRKATETAPAVEYTQGPQKTVVGDTKPNQASGKLSADLAARGKPTASRINNGFKK